MSEDLEGHVIHLLHTLSHLLSHLHLGDLQGACHLACDGLTDGRLTIERKEAAENYHACLLGNLGHTLVHLEDE